MPFYGLYIPVKGEAAKSSANESGQSAVGSSNPTNGNTLSASNAANKNGINTVNAGHTPKQLLSSATPADCKSPFVFNEKTEALQKLKQHKDARLREFDTEDDAVKYASTGFEVVTTRYPVDKNASTVSETNSQFRSPTRQELVIFRKLIEQGEVRKVKDQIWDNPRYLVGYGDTPTTLKEGPRYNALHICAIYKQPKVADLILKTVSDTKFVELLVGKKDDKMSTEFCCNLLDYYLNIAEKGRNETPLHLASKVGCVEMVELLTSYPQCKILPNSDNKYPADVICSRQNMADEVKKRKIENLLGERFYVPVLRSNDNTIPPLIGQPFSQHNPPDLKQDALSPDVKIQAIAGPMDSETAEKFRRRWKTPPRVGSDVSASPLNNSSFISPIKANLRMNNSTPRSSEINSPKEYTRSVFQQRRLLFSSLSEQGDSVDNVVMDKKNGNHTPQQTEPTESTEQAMEVNEESNLNNNNYMEEKKRSLFFKYRDPHPVSPCNLESTPQKRFPQFDMDLPSNRICFSPITSERDSSLFLHDTMHDSRSSECGDCFLPGFKERHIKITDPEKGLECIGRELALKEFSVDWREYWDFLDAFIDIRETEGLELLEAYFAKRKEAELNATKTLKNTALDQVFNALEQITNSPAWNKSNSIAEIEEAYPQAKSKPYKTVEKSLQVYAKRITKVLLCNHQDSLLLSKMLMHELKRLKSLISSFKEDQRFQLVDVSKVHARIARLVNHFVAVSLDITDDIKAAIKQALEASNTLERCDYYKCFCEIFVSISNNNAISTSASSVLHTKEEVYQQDWESEQSCKCDWEFNLSRKTSRRHRYKSGSFQHSSIKDTSGLTQDEDEPQKTDVDQLVSDLKSCMKIEPEDNTMEVMGDDDEFFDCVESDESFVDEFDSDSNDEMFYTPMQSRSMNDLRELQRNSQKESNRIFIYSSIPTKRDVDVLNALADVPLDAKTYPNIMAWKAAVLSYSKDEMADFPTPRVVKKTHVLSVQNQTLNEILGTATSPQKVDTQTTAVQSMNIENKNQIKLPLRKRLLMSPTLKISNKPLGGTTVTTAKFTFNASKIPTAMMPTNSATTN